jgi:hypothetical protein
LVAETIDIRNEADAQPARCRREFMRSGLGDATRRTKFRMGLKLKIVIRFQDEGVHARGGEPRELFVQRGGLRVASEQQVNTAHDGVLLPAGFCVISL